MQIDYSSMLVKSFSESIITFIKQFWYVPLVILLIIISQLITTIIKKKRYSKAGMSEIDKMSGTEFEKYLQSLFTKMGYQVTHTGKTTGDYGVDLVIEKDYKKTAVQAKRSQNYIGQSAIREVFAGKSVYKCDESMVVTNNYFSKMAKKLAKTNNVELWDRNKLTAIILPNKV